MQNEIIEIDTSHIVPPQTGSDLFANRASIVKMQQNDVSAEVSILVFAYNRLEKTKRCVESILQYTQNVDYELILIDNGSSDGTLEYFKSVRYNKLKILHIVQNLGGMYPYMVMRLCDLGRFVCTVSNDLIMTSGWLENLLTVMESDTHIGFVNAVTSNVSNLQSVDISYRTYEEMQRKAAKFNRSDPRKWEDRQRLITLGSLYRKEALMAIGFPMGDTGFFHDFADDDITFRIRRAGYRTVLAGDTWICHDHDFRHGEGKDPVEFQRSMEIGKINFQQKFFGVDAWEDVNNYYIPYVEFFPRPKRSDGVKVLGVDTRCGTPILDIKNWLKKSSVFDTELSAFTQDAKYWLDLKTICSGAVVCDREEFLSDAFPEEYFDYIVADRALNRYHEPQKMINDLFALCKKGGCVICSIQNTLSFQQYVYMLGQFEQFHSEFAYSIPLEAVYASLQKLGTVHATVPVLFGLDKDSQQALKEIIPRGIPAKEQKEILNRLMTERYLMIVQKYS